MREKFKVSEGFKAWTAAVNTAGKVEKTCAACFLVAMAAKVICSIGAEMCKPKQGGK